MIPRVAFSQQQQHQIGSFDFLYCNFATINDAIYFI